MLRLGTAAARPPRHHPHEDQRRNRETVCDAVEGGDMTNGGEPAGNTAAPGEAASVRRG